MSAPGSAARLALFRLTGTHSCWPTWGGSVFILAFRQECVPNAAMYSRLSVLWCYPTGSFSSPHTRHYILFSDFSLSPVFTAVDFGIAALHRDRLMSVIGFIRRLLRLLIILRPDTLIFLTGEQISVFFSAFCALLLGISWQLDSAPSTLLSDAVASAMIPTGQAEKTLQRRESPISCD